MDETETTAERPAPLDALTNIFVLMLENHSFDHVFAMSGIPGIRVATTRDSNSYTLPDSQTPTVYPVLDGAPASMTTDPGHEFGDVLQQLCEVKLCSEAKGEAENANCYSGGPYPEITLSGFASSYATSTSEDTGQPEANHIGDIMACFCTKTQLPVIHKLAREFAICDNWFSSLPGPTWPNRFFVHGASSSGMDRSPHLGEEITWEAVSGFRYGHGSIFEAFDEARPRHKWRLYQDKDNQFSDLPSGVAQGGWISQVAALHGISLLDIHSLKHFETALNERRKRDHKPKYLKYPYTFIEPNFGASFNSPQGKQKGPRYTGGSSQHPEDNMFGGEALIKFVYEAIRRSPVWDTSLLIIVYDEHGGFYDSVKPGPAPAPADPIPKKQKNLNAHGFDFTQLGVRVPAVIVSPLIPKNTVDHTLYDHSSILATVEKWLGMAPLTKRDAGANDLGHLLSNDTPRDDCPETLPDPAPAHRTRTDGDTPPLTDSDNTPIPKGGNMIGFLHILLKTELEQARISGEAEDEIIARFKKITTHRDAGEYLRQMKKKLL